MARPGSNPEYNKKNLLKTETLGIIENVDSSFSRLEMTTHGKCLLAEV